MPTLAKRLEKVRVAASTAMTIKARALREAGVNVIQLTIGEPDFTTPIGAIEAAHQAALAGETKYPPQDGTRRLKEAVQRKFKRDRGLDYALDEIMCGNGGKQVIFDAFMATLDDGDEVVIPAPYWGAYPLMTKLLGGEPVIVNCSQNNGFKPRPEDIEAAITPRTKWLVLNLPNNPSGAACSAQELRAIADVMLKHPHVWIMSDDMYEHLIYGDFAYSTLAAVEPRLRDRTLTISGVSKTYAMTGWRVGFCAGPKDLIRAMVNMQGQATAGVSAIGQAAAAAALDGPQELVTERAAIYRKPPRFRGGRAERHPRHFLPPPGRRVLRVSQHRRLPRPHDGRREKDRDRRGLYPGVAGRSPRCRRARCRLRHEPLCAHQLCDRRREPGGSVPAHREVRCGIEVTARPCPAGGARRGCRRFHRADRRLLGRIPRLRDGCRWRGPGIAGTRQLLLRR